MSLKNIDKETKDHFISNEVESDSGSSDSETESENEQNIVIPIERKRKREGINFLLMDNLTRTQERLSKAQKKIYKLKSEIDTQEVKDRYLKLDLNNREVEIEKLKQVEAKFFYSRIENWIERTLLILFITIYIGTFLFR
jgi:hypothetical protein